MDTVFSNEYLQFFHLTSLPTGDDAQFDLHSHSFYELYYYAAGRAEYRVEGNIYFVSPDTLFLFPPHCFHGICLLSGPAYERYVLNLAPDKGIEEILLAPFHRHHCFPNARRIAGHLNALAGCASLPPDLREIAVDARLRSLLCEIATLSPEETGRPDERARQILQYINAHLREEISLDLLSDTFFLSKNRIQHVFQQATGTSVHRYLTAKRMSLARQLVSEGISPAKAYLLCGYQDYSSFYRAFVKYYGVSPGEASRYPFL